MADQGKWFKLWCSALADDSLENLSLEDWARWARLGAYIKVHGTDGELRIFDPARALQNLFRLPTYREIVSAIMRFPNAIVATEPVFWPHGMFRPPKCVGEILCGSWYLGGRGENIQMVAVDTPLEEAVEKGLMKRCLFVSFRNWNKYQDDLSTQRVKRFRQKNRVDETANETLQEEKRSRREEKRREGITDSPTPEAAPYKMPDPKTDPKRCLVLSYKSRMGVAYDNRDWDKTNFARAMAAATDLLSLCKDFQTSEACLNDLSGEYDRKGFSWTLETIARNAAEWLKKTGRTNADTSRAGLRMAIARRKAEGEGEGGLVKATDGPLPLALRDGPDRGHGNEKDSDQ